MTRWFMDTEFDEDGEAIRLISIALVSEDGREFYAAVDAYHPDAPDQRPRERCSEWVKQNVLSLLPAADSPLWMSRERIAFDLKRILLADGRPEIWAYFADYDWVAFCQLYGRMIDLPKGIPQYCLDLVQEMRRLNVHKKTLPAQVGTEHNALDDARWVRDAFKVLSGVR